MDDPYQNNINQQGETYPTYGEGGEYTYPYQTDYPPREEDDAASDATEGHDEEDQMYWGRVPGHPSSGRDQGGTESRPEGGPHEGQDSSWGGGGNVAWSIRVHHGRLRSRPLPVDPLHGAGSGPDVWWGGVLRSEFRPAQCWEGHVPVKCWQGHAGWVKEWKSDSAVFLIRLDQSDKSLFVRKPNRRVRHIFKNMWFNVFRTKN